MAFKLGNNSIQNLDGVDPQLYKVIVLALTISKVDFGIPRDGGLRTAERQNELYKDDKSQLDGYNKKSYHQSGKAFDVFGYVDGKTSYQTKHMCHIATAILAAASQLGVSLEWGGHWSSFVDMPHFQKTR